MKTLVWLASYPKSGNTWLRILLSHYLAGDEQAIDINQLSIPNAADTTIFEQHGLLCPTELTPQEGDMARLALYRCLGLQGTTQWLKIHDAFRRISSGEWLCPPEVSRWAVYLVRHPADVAISFGYHFGMATPDVVEFMSRSDATIGRKSRLQFAQVLQSWSQHVESWRGQTDIPVVLMRYEDLLLDPVGGFATLVAAIGLPVDHDRIRAAVEATRFDRLQAFEAATGFKERAPRATAPFFRSGRAGQWREQLSAPLRARLAASHSETMADLGYDVGDPL